MTSAWWVAAHLFAMLGFVLVGLGVLALWQALTGTRSERTAFAAALSPDPGAANGNNLFAVAATSASNIWAVGDYLDRTTYQLLALHCC